MEPVPKISAIENLAVMNIEGGDFDSAEQWFAAALAQQPKNITILEAYCAILLHRRSPKAAGSIERLGKADPTNRDLPDFRARLSEDLIR